MANGLEILSVVVGGGLALTQLILAARTWASSRRRKSTIRIERPDGTIIEIEFDGLSDPAQAEDFIRTVLAREESERGAPE